MRFSERIGKRKPKIAIQLDSMDNDLRNSLWNIICMFITKPIQREHWITQTRYYGFVESIWFNHFKETMDSIPHDTTRLISELKHRFLKWDYLEIYDFFDFIAGEDPPFDIEEFIDTVNIILKRELSGYRFINQNLAPITDETEIAEIENAIYNSHERNLNGVKIHLSMALEKLSDKKNPDYRNSIKESISAVESICQIISCKPKAELGKALKLLKTKIPIHSALEQGFIKLYGYTSDSDGIRHSLMDVPNLDQEDALYMLVSCSAFINYLVAKSQKAQIHID